MRMTNVLALMALMCLTACAGTEVEEETEVVEDSGSADTDTESEVEDSDSEEVVDDTDESV